VYRTDSLQVDRYRKFSASDEDLNAIHAVWEQSLRKTVEQLPGINFDNSRRRAP
jgi:predicted proteasome-type protease